jgi:hypothetical protein
MNERSGPDWKRVGFSFLWNEMKTNKRVRQTAPSTITRNGVARVDGVCVCARC